MQTQVFNYSQARAKLADIIDAVDRGMVAMVTSKGRKVAIIPHRMLNELMELREAQHSSADTKSADAPRNYEELPEEVTTAITGTRQEIAEYLALPAHSRAAALASAFEQPPVEPSEDGDDEPMDDELAEELYGQFDGEAQ